MRVLLVWLALMTPAAVLAEAPTVSNVQFTQRTDGSMLLDVTYDAIDADGDTLTVSLQASIDGGETWSAPALHASGDVGDGVAPGTGKTIVWDAGADLPGRELTNLQVRVLASDAGVFHSAHSPALYSIIDWYYIDWEAPGTIEYFARADLIVLTTNFLWGQQEWEDLRVIDKLRAINPDIKVVGYVLAKTVQLDWGAAEQTYPFGHALYEATEPYWCYTTTGDTLQDWRNQVNVNILDPACRAAMAQVIQDFQTTSNNPLDGVFWDYFATSLWWPSDTLFEGEPDLDEDGIPHHEDSDEQAAYRQACEDLVLEVRSTVGEDFIQIFNGTRAQLYSDFAALSDGIHYELFPIQHFETPSMASALDPELPRSLFNTIAWPRTDNGGPYNMISNIQQNFYNDHNRENTLLDLGNLHRAVGLLTGVYASWNSQAGRYDHGWPEVDISLGEPLGPTQIVGNLFTREFEFGRIELEMESGNPPVPFNYRIYIADELVEAFDFPFHYP